ncbi:SPOR domain-containing protein [Microbulbifer yueqingensis]|uniref:Sporulation related domain-containing protein n=1 Tax=Microbulbifer yueqingensis TaxID=658219 RepID=A0A1G9BGJ7_9GAMM|nr:SPOR domain-containing protein [Microbulbifer yueqingensis]SDK38621.1 Sporulation related domain-containing protein [Microbulbifer yueqingensis]
MSRRNASRRSSNAGKPAWVWFVLGNFVGGFAVFMIFLNQLDTDRPGKGARQQEAPAAERAGDDGRSPKFDFYTLLQENEVAVPPPKTKKLVRPERAPAESGSSKDEPPREIAVREERPAAEPGLVYILQAASFRDPAEADKLRAQLVLSNLDVKVETATDSRGTWHRVLIGPYQSRSRVARAREILAEHQLMPLVLKRSPKSG